MQMGNPSFGSKCVGVMLALGLVSPAFAGEVRTVSLEAGSTTTRVEIQLEGKGEYKTISLAGPDRLVVDLPASHAARNLKLPAGAGVIKSVRTGQPTPDTLRIVFDLAKPVGLLKPRMEPSATGARLILEWPGGNPVAVAKPDSAPALTTVEPIPSTTTAAQATAALTTAVVRQAATQAPAPQATVPAQADVVATQPVGNAAPSTSAKPSPQEILNGRASALVPSTAGETRAQPQPEVPPAVVAQQPAPAPVQPEPRIAMRAGMRPLVIAIDPGHGGQDPGAIGPTGKREKDVTLAMARELARQINATAGMKAFLVRDGDFFIPLPQRAQKARAAKADMFVSIHADAAENKNARGSSVYVLSLKGASSQRARWLADKENASDLVGGVRLQQVDNTLSSVLLDLAQSGHMKASEDAAGHVLDGLKRVGNNHKPNIERANFAVLRTSDMPSMLVETAFISNADEERRLIDPAYQRKVAGAVLDGVQTYFTRQPPPGTLFAARAQAAEASRSTSSGSAGAP